MLRTLRFLTPFLFLSLLDAQNTATIVGIVTDQSGAAVPGAQLTVVSTATGFSRSVESNADGQYVVPSIPTGAYTVTVIRAGFQKLERFGIEVTAASKVEVNLELAVGSGTQSVSVTESAPLLQSQTASVSNLVGSQQIVGLPLVSRDFTNLVVLSPGVHVGASANLTEGGSPYAMRAGANYSVNGSIPQANSYLVDGIYNRNLWLNTLVMVPIVDSIQEYRVMTSNYSAEFGESAGAVTAVETKSGTNTFHGNAWEFLRNDKLNANTFFNNRQGVVRPPFRRNEFGATFGGPIVHNKTFFFADYQGIRLAQPQTITTTIPTLALRQMAITGDFSGLGTPIYNPFSTTTGIDGQTVRVAFPNNRIPTSLLDPAAGRILRLLPIPTSSASTNNFTFNPALTQQTDQFDVRADQIAGTSDRLFFRYGYDNSTQVVPGALPAPADAGIGPYLATNGQGITTPLLNQSATLGYTKVLNPTTVSETHFGLIRWNARITPLGSAFSSATALGIPGINVNDRSGGLPGLTITGFQVLGDNSTYPENSQITTFQLDSSLSLIRGSHSIKLGGLFLRHRFNGFSSFPTRGAYTFNGQFTRQVNTSGSQTALADFALGVPDSVNRNILNGTFGMRRWTLAPYIQDSWRPTDRLTIELGFRWQVDAPPYDVHDHWSNLDIRTAKLLVAGVNGNGRRLRNFDLNTPAPRVGLTYALTSDRKTIVRSGFGISYINMDAGGAQLYKNPPYFFNQVIATNINGVPPITLSAGLPTPVQPEINNPAALSAGSFNVWDQSLRQSAILQWSFGVQRELRSDLMLDVAYVGSRGERILVNSLNLNQSVPGPGAQDVRRPYYTINPNLVNVSYRTNSGDSKYESLQVRLDKRFSKGLLFGVSYTWASYLSDVGLVNGGGNGDIQNHTCVACNWGPVPDDFTHVITVNHVYQLPLGPKRAYLKNGLLGALLGNWDINGIWSAHSGSRFTPVLGTNVSNSTGGGTQRPNRTADGNLAGEQRSVTRWFDTTAFTAPAQYAFGNSGTGILFAPGYFNVDLGVVRAFRITERFGLNLRGEAFNAFNRANFNAPNATIGIAQAGAINGTQSARIIQLAIKLSF